MNRAYLYLTLMICFLLTECSSTRSRRNKSTAQPREVTERVVQNYQLTRQADSVTESAIAENSSVNDLHRDDAGYYLPPIDHSQFDYYEQPQSMPTTGSEDSAVQEANLITPAQADSSAQDALQPPLPNAEKRSLVGPAVRIEQEFEHEPLQNDSGNVILPYQQNSAMNSLSALTVEDSETLKFEKHLQELRATEAEFNQAHLPKQSVASESQYSPPSYTESIDETTEDQPKTAVFENAPIDIPYEASIQTWMTHEEPPAASAGKPMIVNNGQHYCPKAREEEQAAIERNCCTDVTIISWMGDDEPYHEAHVETWMNEREALTNREGMAAVTCEPVAETSCAAQSASADSIQRDYYPKKPWVVLDNEVEQRIPTRSKSTWLNDEDVYYAEAPASTWERNDLVYSQAEYCELMENCDQPSYFPDDCSEFTWEQECDYAISVEYVPRYKYTRKTRMVPEYYDVTTCKYVKQKTGPCTYRYVAKYETITRCRMQPEFYYTCDCYYIPKYSKERRYRYVPTCYEKVDNSKKKSSKGKRKPTEKSSAEIRNREMDQRIDALKRQDARAMKYGLSH